MKILLIAGHGDGDCGAVGCGFKEADLTREMVKLIKNALSNYIVTVDIADTSKNWYRYIIKQGGKFDFTAYDYVLEVHFNACVNDPNGNGKTTGTEIYVTRLETGTSVEAKIISGIATLGLKNRGVKVKNFDLIYHIKKKGVSAALLETCFIDDMDDMKIYKAKKNQIAQEVADGIVAGFGLAKKEEKKGGDNVALYKDTKGHWAEKVIDEVTKLGIMNGFEDGTFKPNDKLTRAQAAVIARNIINHLKK